MQEGRKKKAAMNKKTINRFTFLFYLKK